MSKDTAPQPLKAAFWMACSMLCMLVMTYSGRMTTAALNVFQVMEIRSLIGLVLIYPLIRHAGGFAAMRTQRPMQHLGRNVAHYAGQGAWLYALTLIPLAELIAIEFTAPIWTALFAVAFLGERLSGPKLAAMTLGLIGVVVIVRPGFSAFETGQLVVLTAAVFFGVSFTMVKSLTRTESVVSIIFWMLVIQSVLGLVPALIEWRTPPAELWPWLVAISFGGAYAHYCMARALVHADATVVMPMDFLRVPATALLGYLAFSETIDMVTALGALLILAGNAVNLFGRRPPVAGAV